LLEAVKLETAKTKEFAGIVKLLPLQNKKAVFVIKNTDEKLKRATNNLKKWVDVKAASDISAYDVLQRPKMIIDESALESLEKRLSGESK
jgi:large subunit ribosomal protein L4